MGMVVASCFSSWFFCDISLAVFFPSCKWLTVERSCVGASSSVASSLKFVDIDSDDKDPLLCSLYAPDIYYNLRVAELKRRPFPDFMERTQRDVTQTMRGILGVDHTYIVVYSNSSGANVNLLHENKQECGLCHDPAEDYVIASEGLKHRVFEVSLADLQGDEDNAYRKIRLRAEDVQGRNVLTQFWGMDFTTDKLRSLVKKWQTLIEAHVDAISA